MVEGVLRDERVVRVGSEVRVVPVGVGEVEVYLDSIFVGGLAEFLDDIPLEGRLHDTVMEVTIFQDDFWAGRPIRPLLDPGLRVVHTESLVMLRGKGKAPEPRPLEKFHPLARVKPDRVPRLVQFLVFLTFRVRHLQERPRLVRQVPDGINSPVDADAKFHIPKCFMHLEWGVPVIWIGIPLDIVLDILPIAISFGEPNGFLVFLLFHACFLLRIDSSFLFCAFQGIPPLEFQSRTYKDPFPLVWFEGK